MQHLGGDLRQRTSECVTRRKIACQQSFSMCASSASDCPKHRFPGQKMEGFQFIFQWIEDPKKSNAAKHSMVGVLTIIFLAKSTCVLPSNSFGQFKIEFLHKVVSRPAGAYSRTSGSSPKADFVQGEVATVRAPELRTGQRFHGRAHTVAERISMADKIGYSSCFGSSRSRSSMAMTSRTSLYLTPFS